MNENLFNEDNIIEEMPTRTLPSNVAKISVIGVGGGGCNMIDHMIKEGTSKIDLIAANTDLQVLQISRAPSRIQLGHKLTKGLGAGMKPEIGRDSAVESYEDIKAALEGADIVFIAAGLGGGTGTGAAAVVAKAAKEVGALTVAVVTKPFSWEGKRRTGLANLGLEELKSVSDSIIVISNDKVLEIIDESVGMKAAFKIIDNILYQAVNGMSEVILKSGQGDINTDFADVRTIMQYRGVALMGIGRGQGENATAKALTDAIDSPLLDKVSLKGAKGIIVHFTVHPEISLFAITDVMKLVNNATDDDVQTVFGTTYDVTLQKDEVKITVVATGFDRNDSNKELTEEEKIKIGYETKLKNLTPDDENYFDVPPLFRDYKVMYPF